MICTQETARAEVLRLGEIFDADGYTGANVNIDHQDCL